MPTPAERKALFFLAGIIVLGASVRAVRAARGGDTADASTRDALARQLAAVDSARLSEASRRSGGGRGGAGKRRGRTRVPPSADSSRAPPAPGLPLPPIDLDVAAAQDIEALPRIGPVLARRIVDDRTANGPFGSIEGLERVRGVGPALARQLGGRVTFSGTARPSNAVVGSRLSTSSPSPAPERRERRNARRNQR